MAYPPVNTPTFPNVPEDGGVPSIFRDPLAVVYGIQLLAADAIIIASFFTPSFPDYGIFQQDGTPVVLPDTVVALDYRQEWHISNYPVEEGGFQSYDKVLTPYDVRIRMGCDGSTTPKELFLALLEGVAKDTANLYTVRTKDAEYQNATITHLDYRLERESGIGVLAVDVWLQEVRVTVQTSFTNTQAASGASAVNSGTVQTTTPTPGQAAIAPLS